MTQHDFNIANQVGASFRADLNNALEALATLSAGATAPSNPYPYQLWQDTSTGIMKMRNAANDAWMSLGTWANPTNTGFYTNNLLRMLINATGSVGIGTASPTEALDVVGKIKASSGFLVGSRNVMSSMGNVQEGRLTLRAGFPSPDVSSGNEDGYTTTGNTVYFTPYKGNKISLFYAGTASVPAGWYLYDFSQLSITIGTGANINYDIFVRANTSPWNSPTLELASGAWTSDTARNNAISRSDGIYTLASNPEYRYLGTVRTNGSGVVADTPTQRFVWNYDNRLLRRLRVTEGTTSWSYTTATWRYANNISANKVEFVLGLNEDALCATARARASAGSQITVGVGIGLDGNTPIVTSQYLAPSSGQNCGTATFDGFAGSQGYHYLSLLEYGHGTTAATFYGNSAWDAGLSCLIKC